MNAPTILSRQQHQEQVGQLANAREQLARLNKAEANQLAHHERTRPRLDAALVAVREAAAELEAARRDASQGDSLGMAAARRRGDLQRDIDQLEADLADSPWAGQ